MRSARDKASRTASAATSLPRRWRAASRRSVVCSGLLLLVALCLSGPPLAWASSQEEAARQLELAEADLLAGNYERAAASAASALRLDPSRHDALVVRGLALQALGQLDDAAALLRAYRDMRGGLPVDARVEPALAQIEQLQSGKPDRAGRRPKPGPTRRPPAESADAIAVLFSPDEGQSTGKRAYAAARPFLDKKPTTTVLPLDSILPRDNAGVVLGAEASTCGEVTVPGWPAGFLAAAETAIGERDAEAARAAARNAELAIACGDQDMDPSELGRLLSLRAMTGWISGDEEQASRIWRQLFALQPDYPIEEFVPPTARALQLEARQRAAEAPALVELTVLLPDGWLALAHGGPYGGGGLPAGRRVLRLVGPDGARIGLVVELKSGSSATVSTVEYLKQAARGPGADQVGLTWLSDRLAPLMEQGAAGVLLVDLSPTTPHLRSFDGERFLVVSAPARARPEGTRPPPAEVAVPRDGSIALVGGGLAATVAGIIVGLAAHGDGVELQEMMQTGVGFSDNYDAYQSARTGERVGVGLAIGGGVVAAAGALTFVIPAPGSRQGGRAP